MDAKLRHTSWALALAAIPTYAISFWFTSKALLRAAFSEGVGYNVERAEWIASRALSVTTAVLLLLSLITGVRAGGPIAKVWWCVPVIVAFAVLVWWDFVGIGFK